MKQRWQQLTAREQQLIIVMVTVVIVFLSYSVVWRPLQQNIAKTTQKIQQRQQLLTWVKTNTAAYRQAQQHAHLGGGSLTSIVNRTAKANQIIVTRMQPQGDTIQVWINEMPFEQLLTWLDQLSKQEYLQVLAIDITDAKQPGLVQVRRLQLGKA